MKMVPGSGSKPSSVPGPQQRHRFLHARRLFGATWSILVDLGIAQNPRGRQQRAKKFDMPTFGRPEAAPGAQQIVFGGG